MITNVNGLKEFKNKKTGSWGYVYNIFTASTGEQWANVLCFTHRTCRKTAMRVSEMEITE